MPPRKAAMCESTSTTTTTTTTTTTVASTPLASLSTRAQTRSRTAATVDTIASTLASVRSISPLDIPTTTGGNAEGEGVHRGGGRRRAASGVSELVQRLSASTKKKKNGAKTSAVKFCKGQRIEAEDFLGNWYSAKVVDVSKTIGNANKAMESSDVGGSGVASSIGGTGGMDGNQQILIHFDRWNSRYDEWVDCNSPRIRHCSSNAATINNPSLSTVSKKRRRMSTSNSRSTSTTPKGVSLAGSENDANAGESGDDIVVGCSSSSSSMNGRQCNYSSSNSSSDGDNYEEDEEKRTVTFHTEKQRRKKSRKRLHDDSSPSTAYDDILLGLSGETDAGGTAIRCLCGTTADMGVMIQCTTCTTWQHSECVCMDDNDVPERYFCYSCSASFRFAAIDARISGQSHVTNRVLLDGEKEMMDIKRLLRALSVQLSDSIASASAVDGSSSVTRGDNIGQRLDVVEGNEIKLRARIEALLTRLKHDAGSLPTDTIAADSNVNAEVDSVSTAASTPLLNNMFGATTADAAENAIITETETTT